RQRRHRQQPAARVGVRHGARGDHDRVPPDRAPAGRVRVALMHISGGMRWVLRLGTAVTLAFIYIPLIVIVIYAFNESRSQAWPIDGVTLEWFDKAFNNPGVRDAFWTSLKAATGATLIALLLGTLAALAISRYRFFGRDTISFLIILPLALP